MIVVRGVLVGVCLLLASVASASAECAWVLWHESDTVFPRPGVQGGDTVTIVRAFEAKSECEAAAMDHAKGREGENRADAAYTKVSRKGSWVFWETDIALGSNRYRCLPDTVDPRGPKR